MNLTPPPQVQTILLGEIPIFLLASGMDLPDLDSTLLPQDIAAAADRRHPLRKAELLRSRWLIRKLTNLAEPLTYHPGGNICWPPPWVGSLTHKDGHVACCLARKALSIGVDLEDCNRPSEEWGPRLCRPEELDSLSAKVNEVGIRPSLALTVVFAAKEALFKCHYPLGQKMFYFHDAKVIDLVVEGQNAIDGGGVRDAIDGGGVRGSITFAMMTDTSPKTPVNSHCQSFYQTVMVEDKSYVLASAVLNPD